MNFALFLEAMPETDAFDLIEDAGGDTGAITNIDDAVDGLTYDDITADFRVKFAGEGVSGRTFTDAFSSEAAAENFIDAVHLAATDNGFLDDILL